MRAPGIVLPLKHRWHSSDGGTFAFSAEVSEPSPLHAQMQTFFLLSFALVLPVLKPAGFSTWSKPRKVLRRLLPRLRPNASRSQSERCPGTTVEHPRSSIPLHVPRFIALGCLVIACASVAVVASGFLRNVWQDLALRLRSPKCTLLHARPSVFLRAAQGGLLFGSDAVRF